MMRALGHRLGAAVCLPAALASVLLGLVPSPGLAARSLSAVPRDPSLRENIANAAGQGTLTFLLYEGMPVSGRFAAFAGNWKDTSSAEARYEDWRAGQPERTPRFGEKLAIVLTSGDTLQGSFEGVADQAIALRTTSGFSATPVRFADVAQVLDAGGDPVAPWAALRERLAAAPELVAVLLSQGPAGSVLVSRDRILQVSVVPDPHSHGSDIAVAVIISVIVTGVVCAALLGKAIDDSFESCSSAPNNTPTRLDRRFGAATLSSGPRPYAPGDTRRP